MRWRGTDGCCCWRAKRGSARAASPTSWPRTRGRAARESSGGAAGRRGALRRTGRGSSRSEPICGSATRTPCAQSSARVPATSCRCCLSSQSYTKTSSPPTRGIRRALDSGCSSRLPAFSEPPRRTAPWSSCWTICTPPTPRRCCCCASWQASSADAASCSSAPIETRSSGPAIRAWRRSPSCCAWARRGCSGFPGSVRRPSLATSRMSPGPSPPGPSRTPSIRRRRGTRCSSAS